MRSFSQWAKRGQRANNKCTRWPHAIARCVSHDKVWHHEDYFQLTQSGKSKLRYTVWRSRRGTCTGASLPDGVADAGLVLALAYLTV